MLENLINDLIDMAKIENNKFSLNQDFYDLTHTVHQTLEILLFQANEKKIEFNVIIDKKSNLSLIKQIYGDTRRIKQILINFISNSFKFTTIGGKITISIRINEEQQVKKDEMIRFRSIDQLKFQKLLDAKSEK